MTPKHGSRWTILVTTFVLAVVICLGLYGLARLIERFLWSGLG